MVKRNPQEVVKGIEAWLTERIQGDPGKTRHLSSVLWGVIVLRSHREAYACRFYGFA